MNEKQENVVEVSTKPKKTTKSIVNEEVKSVEENNDNSNIKDKEIEDLKNTVNAQSVQIAQLLEALNKSLNNSQNAAPISNEKKKYKLINLSSPHNEMSIRANGKVFPMKGYCDQRSFDEEDFLDIGRNHRKHFLCGVLATDSEGARLLQDIGINISPRWLSKKDLETLDELSKDELVKLYNSLHPLQQERLIDTFLEGLGEGVKKGYKNIEKVSALNKLYTKNNVYKERLKNAVLKLADN